MRRRVRDAPTPRQIAQSGRRRGSARATKATCTSSARCRVSNAWSAWTRKRRAASGRRTANARATRECTADVCNPATLAHPSADSPLARLSPSRQWLHANQLRQIVRHVPSCRRQGISEGGHGRRSPASWRRCLLAMRGRAQGLCAMGDDGRVRGKMLGRVAAAHPPAGPTDCSLPQRPVHRRYPLLTLLAVRPCVLCCARRCAHRCAHRCVRCGAQSNKDYMADHCRRSCGLCSEEPCTDEQETTCPAWARSGHCTSNADYMSKACRHSCGLCGKAKDADAAAAACVDKHQKKGECAKWAASGQCTGARIAQPHMSPDNR